MFRDRSDAGRRLAVQLNPLKGSGPLVLALPRGGVPVGYEIAEALDAVLDVVLVQKLPAPGQPDIAIGTVVEGDPPESMIRQDVVAGLHIADSAIEAATSRAILEIERRRSIYRAGRPREALAEAAVILVDDGVATGITIHAAVRAIRRAGPARLVLAVPVAPAEVVRALAAEMDAVVCLASPPEIVAVSMFYEDYAPVSDADVVELLKAAARD